MQSLWSIAIFSLLFLAVQGSFLKYSKSDNYRRVLMRLDSQVSSITCPSHHPFAYFNGQYCCATQREKNYHPQGYRCDGGVLAFDSLCCEDDKFVKCYGKRCTDFQRCPDTQCGSIQCPFGVETFNDKNGYLKCECKPNPCPTTTCDKLRCAFGLNQFNDKDGCPQCTCKPDPCPVTCGTIKCQFGVIESKDTNGCIQCQCKPNPYPAWPTGYRWSTIGPIFGMDCIHIQNMASTDKRSAQRTNWMGTHFCWNKDRQNPGLRWSTSGLIEGMRCTKIYEPSDPNFPTDQAYLCVPNDFPYHFSWSCGGAINGLECINWFTNTAAWNDNYLCAK